jgi:membrane associated rhomboid family serine protease
MTICGLAIVATFAYAKPGPFVDLLITRADKVWDGELWRMLTCVFPHVHLLHLVFNLYWMWKFGSILEDWLGPVQYAVLCLLLAAGPAAAEFLATAVGGVGLSGVVYGFFGVLFALRHDKDFAAAEMQPRIVQFFIGWFFVCIALTYTKIMPVGNVAHGAGAVLGWLVGQAILTRWRVWLLAGLSALVLALCATTLYMPWNASYSIYRGQKYVEQRDYARALYWYEMAYRVSPTHPHLHEYVLWLRHRVEKPDED